LPLILCLFFACLSLIAAHSLPLHIREFARQLAELNATVSGLHSGAEKVGDARRHGNAGGSPDGGSPVREKLGGYVASSNTTRCLGTGGAATWDHAETSENPGRNADTSEGYSAYDGSIETSERYGTCEDGTFSAESQVTLHC